MLGCDFVEIFLEPWATDIRPLITDAAPADKPALKKSLLPIIYIAPLRISFNSTLIDSYSMALILFMGCQISNYATWVSHMQVMIESAIRYNRMAISPAYYYPNQVLPPS